MQNPAPGKEDLLVRTHAGADQLGSSSGGKALGWWRPRAEREPAAETANSGGGGSNESVAAQPREGIIPRFGSPSMGQILINRSRFSGGHQELRVWKTCPVKEG